MLLSDLLFVFSSCLGGNSRLIHYAALQLSRRRGREVNACGLRRRLAPEVDKGNLTLETVAVWKSFNHSSLHAYLLLLHPSEAQEIAAHLLKGVNDPKFFKKCIGSHQSPEVIDSLLRIAHTLGIALAICEVKRELYRYVWRTLFFINAIVYVQSSALKTSSLSSVKAVFEDLTKDLLERLEEWMAVMPDRLAFSPLFLQVQARFILSS